MKRIFSFLVLVVLFTGCDDGDMGEVSFEFDDTSALVCNVSGEDEDYFIYKTTDQRALLLQLSELNFSNTLTGDTLNGAQIDLVLGGRNKLIYRVYSGDIGTNTICSAIPPSSPIVTEERTAISGKAYIKTDPVKSNIAADGSNRITDYTHTITFSDVTFNLGNGSQRNETLPPMVYTRRAPTFSTFDLPTPLSKCTNRKNLLYRVNNSTITNSQVMKLELNDASVAALFNTVTDVPKLQYLSNEEDAVNKLTHLFYGNTSTNPLNSDFFCSETPPNFPTVKDIWTGEEGAEIEVITTVVDANVYRHTITLKGVKMFKGANQNFFFLKTNFVFGSFDETIAPAPAP